MRLASTGNGTRAHLLDVQTPSGDLYYWSDQQLSGIVPVIAAANAVAGATVTYSAWVLNPPSIKRTRSLATDSGSFVLQNLSGDTLARDFERILRRSIMEGAICAYRLYNIASETADLSFQGRISVQDVSASRATLSIAQILDGSADTPGMQLSETCQLDWAKARCGATGPTECLYSLQTCQVQERIVAISNTFYDKNFSEAVGAVPVNLINRRRRI